MLEQLDELLNAPTTGASAPSLACMEDALTEGYAKALALEAERWRLERRLGEVARTVAGPAPDVSNVAEELSSLSQAPDERRRGARSGCVRASARCRNAPAACAARPARPTRRADWS